MTEDKRQAAIIEEAKAFVDAEIRPFVNDFEEKGGVPLELIRKMAAKGYLAAPFPEKYGGLGLDPVYYGLFTEVFGKLVWRQEALLLYIHHWLVKPCCVSNGGAKESGCRSWPGEKRLPLSVCRSRISGLMQKYHDHLNEEDDCYVINGRKVDHFR